MTWMERGRNVIAEIVRTGEYEPLFHGQTRTLRQIETGEDVYRILANPGRRLREILLRRIGPDALATLARLDEAWPVSQEQARLFLHWMSGAPGSPAMIGSYVELVEAKRGTILSRLFQGDHINEQRIGRMLLDGPNGHMARSLEHALPDADAQRALERRLGATNLANRTPMLEALTILVPANEIVAYRLGRHLRRLTGLPSAAPYFYHHLGLKSKTQRMRQLIPWRLEGEYSYQEILDASRYVHCYELGMPPGYQELIRDDLVDSIVHAIQHDEVAAEIILPQLPGRIRSPDSPQLEAAIQQSLSLGPLDPATFLANWRKTNPITGPIDETVEAEADLAQLRAGLGDE